MCAAVPPHQMQQSRCEFDLSVFTCWPTRPHLPSLADACVRQCAGFAALQGFLRSHTSHLDSAGKGSADTNCLRAVHRVASRVAWRA
eukprot:2721648-Alexandrium_andersonii.AAC.1